MKAKMLLILALAGFFFACAAIDPVEFRRDAPPRPMTADQAERFKLDFRYSPPWWQTAICLPDDPQKTLVSKEGVLLYEYDKGGGLTSFGTHVSISIADVAASSTTQFMNDAQVPVVETAFFDGSGGEIGRTAALAVVPNGMAAGRRVDLLLIKKADAAATIVVTVESRHKISIKPNDFGVYLDGNRFLTASGPWQRTDAGAGKLVITYPKALPELAVTCSFEQPDNTIDLEWAKKQAANAVSYWKARNFPYEAIRVPDAAAQSVLDSCIRNIYQAREAMDGLPIFQVGPTCYRGLWVVDGCFILEAMTFLGRGQEARSGIDHLLTRQRPDGSFEILEKYWKENGIVLYILCRHALLTGDMGWLRGKWPVVKRVVDVIKRLRQESCRDPNAPEAGLMPAGFTDGGIGGAAAEYSNVYWNLAGLGAAIEAARLIQATELADWEAEYRDFMETFRKAVKRDAKPYGERLIILPTLMKENPAITPIRGQWAFCHAVFPGKIFQDDDPLVLGNMALLDDHPSEGLVLGTGWMKDGIWNYFASFWAHAHLWLGHGEKASEILYAYANHAAPTRVWREEQLPKGQDQAGNFVGDMPHNWASAEFIRLTRNLLVLERGSELHFLEGIPRVWLAPEAVTELNDVATDFGPVSMRLEVAANGKTAHLRITPPIRSNPSRIVVHLGAWAASGRPKAWKKDRALEMTISLP